MRRMNVLGISLYDLSVREAMRKVDDYLNNGSLNTVSFLTHELLLDAKDDPVVKEALENTDLVIPCSVEILKAAELLGRAREKEVENHQFQYELLHKLAKERRRIFLIAQTQEDLVRLRSSLLEQEEKLTFFGSYAYNELPGESDGIINEINGVLPDVIISMLESPLQERLVQEQKRKVNASLWVCLQEGNLKVSASGGKGLGSWISNVIFKRAVSRYEQQ